MLNIRMEKLFWGHTSKKNPDYVTLYFRITISGNRAELGSTGVKVHKRHWNADTQRITARTAEGQQDNHTLDIWRERVQAIYNELLLKKEPFTAGTVKKLFQQDGRGFTYVALFQLYMDQIKRDPAISLGTWQTYEVVRRKVTAWLTATNQADLPAELFGSGMMERYRTFLRIDEGRLPATVRKHTSTAKQVLTFGYLNDYITRDPLQGYRVLREKTGPPITLTADELIGMMNYDFSEEPVLGEVRDYFLISCFNGMAYSDMKTFKSSHFVYKAVQTHQDATPIGLIWIEKPRVKTGKTAQQPLHPIARQILEDRYEGKPERMHIRPNQKTNLYLKVIALRIGITQKKLTTHVGRKTFANMCLNGGLYSSVFADYCPEILNYQNSKFSTESTLAMMGRTSSKGLDAYATPGEQSIMLELKTKPVRSDESGGLQ